MPKKRRIVKKTTLLMVGEGVVDKAFIDHMRSLYVKTVANFSVVSDSADGGSPLGMINYLIRKTRHVQYDQKVLLLDSDIAITDEVKKAAKRGEVQLVLSKPICLEGMLLDVLNTTNIPDTAVRCKKQLHPMLNGSPVNKCSYQPLFAKAVLDTTHVKTIQRLIQYLTNRSP